MNMLRTYLWINWKNLRTFKSISIFTGSYKKSVISTSNTNQEYYWYQNCKKIARLDFGLPVWYYTKTEKKSMNSSLLPNLDFDTKDQVFIYLVSLGMLYMLNENVRINFSVNWFSSNLHLFKLEFIPGLCFKQPPLNERKKFPSIK